MPGQKFEEPITKERLTRILHTAGYSDFSLDDLPDDAMIESFDIVLDDADADGPRLDVVTSEVSGFRFY